MFPLQVICLFLKINVVDSVVEGHPALRECLNLPPIRPSCDLHVFSLLEECWKRDGSKIHHQINPKDNT